MTIASEAKAIAVAEAGIKSRATGLAATGTGTDCTVVTSSLERTRSAARYAGKHTALGAAIGAATHAAVHAGVRAWLEERRA